MTAQATLHRNDDIVIVTVPSGGYTSGQVIQLPDGRAGVVTGLRNPIAGDSAAIATKGKFTVAKVTGVVCLKGSRAFWKRSSSAATPLRPVAGADFPIGTFQGDGASTDTTIVVELNEKPRSLIDIHENDFETLVVKTVVGSTTVEVPHVIPMGGAQSMLLGATAEAQKIDLMSTLSVPVSVPFIAEGRFAIYDIGNNAALDINVGVANGTHATDADAITEHCFFHLDGTSYEVNAQSKDGTTTVAAADTLVLSVTGVYFQWAIDARNLANVLLYINGVRVLAGSTFRLDHATGPLKLLAHMEKTSNATTGDVRVGEMSLRATDLAA